jgi:hypothetical protein
LVRGELSGFDESFIVGYAKVLVVYPKIVDFIINIVEVTTATENY